jgi:hypothetical protein
VFCSGYRDKKVVGVFVLRFSLRRFSHHVIASTPPDGFSAGNGDGGAVERTFIWQLEAVVGGWHWLGPGPPAFDQVVTWFCHRHLEFHLEAVDGNASTFIQWFWGGDAPHPTCWSPALGAFLGTINSACCQGLGPISSVAILMRRLLKLRPKLILLAAVYVVVNTADAFLRS